MTAILLSIFLSLPTQATYVLETTAPVVLTTGAGSQKEKLAAAVGAITSSIEGVDTFDKTKLDEIYCWFKSEVSMCRAWEDLGTVTDDGKFLALAAAGSTARRNKYGPIEITEGALMTADMFTQSLWGRDAQTMRAWRCRRANPQDLTEISCVMSPIKTASASVFRADQEAEKVVKILSVQ